MKMKNVGCIVQDQNVIFQEEFLYNSGIAVNVQTKTWSMTGHCPIQNDAKNLNAIIRVPKPIQ
jgi:hypothetical protein